MGSSNRAKTLFVKVARSSQPEENGGAEPPVSVRPVPSPTVRKLQSLLGESAYYEVLHSLYDGVLMADAKGRMLDANVKACQLCNGSKADICRLSVSDILLGIDQSLMPSVIEALGTGQHVVVETDCQRMDGTVFPCEASVMRIEVAGESHLCFFLHDVSQRKHAEQQLTAAKEELEKRNLDLQASEETLRTSLEQVQAGEKELARERDLLRVLMDNIPDRIFLKDSECRFLRINKALASFHGLSGPDEAIGKSDFDFFDEATARGFYEDDRRVMRTGEPLIDKVQKMERADGLTRWSSVTKAPIRDSDGSIIGLVGMSRDITERVRAEEELKAAQRQLEKVNRLEATSLFAGQIAHDFNNLLVPLLVYPDIIKKTMNPESQNYKDLEIMQTTAQQIADINQDLMALSRRGKMRQELVDLNSAVMEIAESFQRSVVQEGVRVDCYPLARPATVIFDPPQLTRVLQNLCQNAVDAVSDQGRVAIKTENVVLDKPFGNCPKVIPGEYVRVTVSDNGCGIPDEIKEKIFDPFFTTKATRGKRRGSGLGLSVVYGIVIDHRGYIDFESRVGQGTSFSLFFPVEKGQVEKPVQPDICGGTEGVLIVDDDPLETEVMTRALAELGYRVTAVASGEEAIQALKSAGGPGADGEERGKRFPDIAVLDIVLGNGMDGVETYQQLKSVHPQLKAITMSGYREPDRVTTAQSLGAGRHLIKPVTFATIAQAVRQELDRTAQPAQGS